RSILEIEGNIERRFCTFFSLLKETRNASNPRRDRRESNSKSLQRVSAGEKRRHFSRSWPEPESQPSEREERISLDVLAILMEEQRRTVKRRRLLESGVKE